MAVEASILERTDGLSAPVLAETTTLPPVEGRRNIATITVARHANRIEQLRRRAGIIARERNGGEVDTACLVAAAHEVGFLTEVDSRFATVHPAEVADATGIPLTPVGRKAKRAIEDPLVAQIFQEAQLRALDQQQSIVRPEDVLIVLAQTPSVGSVALERLRSIAEERTTTPVINNRVLDAMMQSRDPLVRSILRRI